MAKALLKWCELPVSASKLGACHVCADLVVSYTITQRSAHPPGKQKVAGPNPGPVVRLDIKFRPIWLAECREW